MTHPRIAASRRVRARPRGLRRSTTPAPSAPTSPPASPSPAAPSATPSVGPPSTGRRASIRRTRTPSGSPSTGRRTPTTPGSTSPRAKGWYRDAGHRRSRSCPTRRCRPRRLIAAGQAECGISFQDSMTFAVAAGRRHRERHGDPPADGVGDRACWPTARSSGRATSTARRTRASATRTRIPTLKVVIKADGGTGAFKVARLDSSAYEALYNNKADFTIPFTAWEGVEADRARHQAALLPVRRLRLPRLLPGRPRLLDRLWLARHPDAAQAVRRRDRQRGFRSPRPTRTRPPAILVAENPGVFDANPKLPEDSREVPRHRGLPRRRDRARSGRQTLEQWTALLEVPVRPGPPDRRRREAAHRLRPTTRRCSRTSSCPDPTASRRPSVLVVVLLAAWEAYARR